MIIRRQSPFSGKINQMNLPITQEQIRAYQNGALLQDAFPNLTAGQREFYKTGITEDEWNNAFAEQD